MKKLELDGVEVCWSWLSVRSYKAKSCSLMLPVRPDNKDAALAKYREAGFAGDYSGLRITGIRDLSFLSEFPDMLYLELSDEPVDPAHLEPLSNLRGLQVGGTRSGIDFSCFPQLESFFGSWHEGHRNLDQLQELRHLGFGSFTSKTKDLTPLANITRLDRLDLRQPKVQSLDGIESLEDLQILDVYRATNLESLSALIHGMPGMRELSLYKCKKIRSYAPIASIERLRRLNLSDCVETADLSWTKGMDYLDFFSFVDTKVVDGDLTPLLELPRLRYVGSMNKRHHSHTCEQLMALLEEQRGGA